MNRKRKWITAGILAVSLTCTAHAETIDMGGFQIQVGQKQNIETESPDRNSTQQKSGQASWQKQETEIPEKTSEENSGGISVEHPYVESQAGTPQQATDSAPEVWGQTGQSEPELEEQTYPVSEEIVQIYQWPESEPGGETVDASGTGQQEEKLQAGEETEMQKQNPSYENKAQEKPKDEKKAGEDKDAKEKQQNAEIQKKTEKTAAKQEVQFIHSDFIRLKSGMLPSVRIKGQQEICVVSYAVNHQECACRWAGNRLLPVDPPLRKGINCLEISVFSEEGRVISMEPWYFSCGVGSAML